MQAPDLLTEKSKGLMFRPEMVRAILNGRKTQTRRLNTTLKRGDLVYVKETWQRCPGPCAVMPYPCYKYRADGGEYVCERNTHKVERISPWQSSLFMPKSAARIWLRVLDVRKERLQDITEEDARAEGFEAIPSKCYYPAIGGVVEATAVTHLSSYWNTINKKLGTRWEDNPEVFAITFERVA